MYSFSQACHYLGYIENKTGDMAVVAISSQRSRLRPFGRLRATASQVAQSAKKRPVRRTGPTGWDGGFVGFVPLNEPPERGGDERQDQQARPGATVVG
jgi:hypothetical protein